jgi:chromosome segregation ATPase
MYILPGHQSGQIFGRKGASRGTILTQAEDIPSLETKVEETRARIEELMATRETLDEELNELTSKKEKLQDEIAYYVKMKVDRSKLNFKMAPAQRRHLRSPPAPKSEKGATSILSALFSLHSIVIPDSSP